MKGKVLKCASLLIFIFIFSSCGTNTPTQTNFGLPDAVGPVQRTQTNVSQSAVNGTLQENYIISEPQVDPNLSEETVEEHQKVSNCDGSLPIFTYTHSLVQSQLTSFEVQSEVGGLIKGAPIPNFLEAQLEAKLSASLGIINQDQDATTVTLSFITPNHEARDYKILLKKTIRTGVIPITLGDKTGSLKFHRVIGLSLEHNSFQPIRCENAGQEDKTLTIPVFTPTSLPEPIDTQNPTPTQVSTLTPSPTATSTENLDLASYSLYYDSINHNASQLWHLEGLDNSVDSYCLISDKNGPMQINCKRYNGSRNIIDLRPSARSAKGIGAKVQLFPAGPVLKFECRWISNDKNQSLYFQYTLLENAIVLEELLEKSGSYSTVDSISKTVRWDTPHSMFIIREGDTAKFFIDGNQIYLSSPPDLSTYNMDYWGFTTSALPDSDTIIGGILSAYFR